MTEQILLPMCKTPSQILDDMTLFDDDLMSMVFSNNIEATALLLRIILEQDDLEVLSVEGQKDMENPLVDGRNLRLDIFAKDSAGRFHNIEVQRSNSGAIPQRARFHSAMLDTRMLKQAEDFKKLAESYVIFITEHDFWGYSEPLYRIERTLCGHPTAFGDGNHIIYVNGQYRGNDAIGWLIHDFHCKAPEDMFYDELSRGVSHFKTTEGGRDAMCDAVKEYAKEYAEETRLNAILENVRNAMESFSISFDQAVKALKISEADAAILAEKI